MKSLNTRVDTLEAFGAGAGVTVSAAQGYLPEKSTLPKIFDGSVERLEVRFRGPFSTRRTQACTCFWNKLRKAEMNLSGAVSSRSGLALGPERQRTKLLCGVR